MSYYKMKSQLQKGLRAVVCAANRLKRAVKLYTYVNNKVHRSA